MGFRGDLEGVADYEVIIAAQDGRTGRWGWVAWDTDDIEWEPGEEAKWTALAAKSDNLTVEITDEGDIPNDVQNAVEDTDFPRSLGMIHYADDHDYWMEDWIVLVMPAASPAIITQRLSAELGYAQGLRSFDPGTGDGPAEGWRGPDGKGRPLTEREASGRAAREASREGGSKHDRARPGPAADRAAAMRSGRVSCADCGQITPAWIEDDSTRLEGHPGVWADCPDCGVTGYDEVQPKEGEAKLSDLIDQLNQENAPPGGWGDDEAPDQRSSLKAAASSNRRELRYEARELAERLGMVWADRKTKGAQRAAAARRAVPPNTQLARSLGVKPRRRFDRRPYSLVAFEDADPYTLPRMADYARLGGYSARIVRGRAGDRLYVAPRKTRRTRRRS